mmetsp:Transcript_12315/g.39386  ORF Transcript_12315/g.39386 Transcript_12315/m.39386 type:complete len:169 (+) Transcript_12315:39-545(+)|eukprot:CAMPEP_0196780128 /NCGR_PEP_ID=MMETSP1104-20130614/7187_1 /TAXON_ID=33652 /ORGANISM="Cafeteria sp., Strain Caron Lab Isolate" /LENGTH=168 /DNA_ID=CAMNT_0042150319 /DNA_START=40 /DNA_END=546 /DNA_ORIENTATION=-
MRLGVVLSIGAILVILAIGADARRPRDPKECEVCIKVVEGVRGLVKAGKEKDKEHIETQIDKYCAKKELDPKQKKACYYMSVIKREVSTPFAMGMPSQDICYRKLRRKNTELCEMRFPEKVERGNTDYAKMRIKQLRNILAERGVDCVGCIEKTDFVRRCKETEHMEL